MSTKPKAGSVSRRVKNGTNETISSKSSTMKDNAKDKDTASANKTTSTIVKAPPTEVTVTTPTPTLQMNDTFASRSKSRSNNDDHVTSSPRGDNNESGLTTSSMASSHGSGDESKYRGVDEASTASLSDVSVRYSLTPGTTAENPDLNGTQVVIVSDPLGVNKECMNMKLDNNNNGNGNMALVLAGSNHPHLLTPGYNHEGYSSSDDSTSSPRSAGQEHQQLDIVRPGSKTDSSNSSSIAVNCHTGPSEVIVKGKNVRKIRVKFPPQPPANNDEFQSLSSIDKQPRSGHFRRQANMYRSAGAQPQEHGDENQDGGHDHVTQSHDSSNGCSRGGHYALALNTAPVLPGIHGMRVGGGAGAGTGASEQFSPGLRDSGISALSLNMNFSGFEYEQKIKHDIINGIEYFEKKNNEMKQFNNQLLIDLEHLRRVNNQLDDRLKLAAERNKELSGDNDELKIRLDQREKEQDRLKDQAMTQWQSRIKSEELYMELKRDSDVEIKRLKDMLSDKEKEITHIVTSAAQKEKAIRNSIKEPGIANKSLRANMEDHLELLHKIARLEEEISKLKGDNEREKLGSKKSKEEAETLKVKLKEHGTELDSQYKRFLSLKKNFNDLRDENEKLKLQLRGRRAGVNPNNTWPKNTTEVLKSSESEAVSYFDIPTKFAKVNSPASKKSIKPIIEHKRTPSEGRSVISENLPPVPSAFK